MHSLLLTRRLYFLSHALTRHKFSISEVSRTRDDISQARISLYSDMLQYYKENPDYGYNDIYNHFVDEEAQQMLSDRHHRNLLIAVSICCIIAVIVGFAVLNKIMLHILENVPISYIRV